MLLSHSFPRVFLCVSLALLCSASLASTLCAAENPWIVFDGNPEGIGAGKHIVFVTGDEEYRSEEAMPMLAKILSKRHGFQCTVLFAIDKSTGEINPNTKDNIPGLKALETADLMFVFARFRELPDEQMQHIDAYLQSGKPVIGIRPSVVAFRNKLGSTYEKYSSNYRGEDFAHGFGRQVLGATWISHHGRHRHESTRGLPADAMKEHPILRGVETMWGPTDVYTVNKPILHDGKILVMGQVLKGMKPDAPISPKAQMPMAWIKTFPTPAGDARVFTSTMGDAQDFQDENLRRMVVNACLWAVGREEMIPKKTNVDPIVAYTPTPFGFNRFIKGRFPRDYAHVESQSGQIDFQLNQGDRVCYIGNTLADRMQHFGWFETLAQSRFPRKQLVFRNLGFSADELTIRPRSMNFGEPHKHLAHSKADVVFAFFGYNESFDGKAGLDDFRRNLTRFITETRSHKYNGRTPPRLVLFSPIAHENLHDPNLPDGTENNKRLAMYTTAMSEVAKHHKVPFVDLFNPTLSMLGKTKADAKLTINGIHLNNEGNRRVAEIIDQTLFGKSPKYDEKQLERVRKAVLTKNLRWFNRYRATDGYSTYGQRSQLKFVDGQTNYVVMQHELKMLDVMTANRDQGIWAAVQNREHTIDDSNVPKPLPVETNIGGKTRSSKAEKEGSLNYLGGEEAISKMKVAKGMQVNLFASEEQFPELVNPVQSAIDSDGRMWVSAWHTYPHWHPNKPLNDKLLIFPDEDRDGKADRCIVFADGLHSPTGFEFWNGGVLVACAPDIFFLKDTDGDDKADVQIRILHGIDSADTHCSANAFVLGPDGCIYFSEGVFHFTNIETPWGKPLRTKAPMQYRWDPRTGKISNHFYLSPNPHGNVFDDWGNLFAIDATTGRGYYVGFPGQGTPHDLYRKRVRPVAGAGMISGSHFPQANRGNLLLCNTIGFLGVLQHQMTVRGADFTCQEIEPIVVSSDGNFRPADVEIGADGALYILDWHNVIIGHMQHNIRDPSRDHAHGRIYRVTAEGRPLVAAVKLRNKPIDEVVRHLASPEYALRYRARIELSGRDSEQVVAAAKAWAANFDSNNPEDAHHLLEALWLHEQHSRIDESLLRMVLLSPDARARAAATIVLGHWVGQIDEAATLLQQQARDESPLVRAQAVVAATNLAGMAAAEVVFEAAMRPVDDPQMEYVLKQAHELLQLERLLSEALSSGKQLSPAAQTYALRNLPVDDVLKLAKSEALYQSIIRREDISTGDLQKALVGLARLRKVDSLALLFTLIDDLDASDSGKDLAGLSKLLLRQPPAQLQHKREQLKRLALSGKAGVTRRCGYAGWITAEESASKAFATALRDRNRLRDLLEALPLIPDESVRSSLFPLVRPLMSELPARLQETNGSPSGLPDDTLHALAIESLRSISGHDEQKAISLAELIQSGKHQASAMQVMRSIAPQHWPKDDTAPLAEALLTYLAQTPAKHRTGGPASDAMELTSQLASMLPTAQSASVRLRLEALRVQVIALGTVPHRMIYDKQQIVVQAGRPVEFRFSNSDNMPHNFAVVQPGSLAEVGELAESTGNAADAAKRHFIPASDKVLLASRLLHPSDTQTLFFEVPAELGVYPYVCTFPGHWRRMNGSLLVVGDLKEYMRDSAAYLAKHPLSLLDEQLKYNERNTDWKVEALIDSVKPLEPGRAFDVGKAMFKVASCTGCHQLQGVGTNIGPDLTKLDTVKCTPEHILRSILNPSDEIAEKYQSHTFALDTGKVITGMVVGETAATVSVVVDPLANANPVVINKQNIEEQIRSKASIMPGGLLSKLKREEVLDLVAYVYARGDKNHKLFGGCSHHNQVPENATSANEKPKMRVFKDVENSQIEMVEGDRPVLRYNYQLVHPPVGLMEKVQVGSRKYAVARSNYIHPLYGPDGELLTKDWPVEHPHHRGIYWAWPEVAFGQNRGDLHALQHVFARPTGEITLESGEEFCKIVAKHLWKWKDTTPIVRETATIVAHRSDERGRLIDLKFEFTAIEEGVTLARRNQKAYGGLNIRLSPTQGHRLVHHADPANVNPRHAWSDSIGIRGSGTKPVGFAVFEKATNPQYPGDYIEYAKLPWFQPTFPRAGTRYELKKGEPLILEYRLWIRRDNCASPKVYDQQVYAQRWRELNASEAEILKEQPSELERAKHEK